MVNYICEKCNKVFSQKGHYDRHINRKYQCNQKNSNLTDYSKNGIIIPTRIIDIVIINSAFFTHCS